MKIFNNRVKHEYRFIRWRTQNMVEFKCFESTARISSGIEMIKKIKLQLLAFPMISTDYAIS